MDIDVKDYDKENIKKSIIKVFNLEKLNEKDIEIIDKFINIYNANKESLFEIDENKIVDSEDNFNKKILSFIEYEFSEAFKIFNKEETTEKILLKIENFKKYFRKKFIKKIIDLKKEEDKTIFFDDINNAICYVFNEKDINLNKDDVNKYLNELKENLMSENLISQIEKL